MNSIYDNTISLWFMNMNSTYDFINFHEQEFIRSILWLRHWPLCSDTMSCEIISEFRGCLDSSRLRKRWTWIFAVSKAWKFEAWRMFAWKFEYSSSLSTVTQAHVEVESHGFQVKFKFRVDASVPISPGRRAHIDWGQTGPCAGTARQPRRGYWWMRPILLIHSKAVLMSQGRAHTFESL